MKKRIIALTLAVLVALSSTSAFAATTNCIRVNYKYNLNDLLKNAKKVTINGKEVDLKTIDWKTLLKQDGPAEKPVTPAQKPAVPAEKPAAPVQKPAAPVQKPAPVQNQLLRQKSRLLRLKNLQLRHKITLVFLRQT